MPNIIKTIASENKGIEEIAGEINRHQDYLKTNKLFISKREKQTKNRIKNIVENKLKQKLWSESAENSLNLSLEKVVLGALSPYQIAENILDNFVSHKK
jgi:LAO/AO transport system kinase